LRGGRSDDEINKENNINLKFCPCLNSMLQHGVKGRNNHGLQPCGNVNPISFTVPEGHESRCIYCRYLRLKCGVNLMEVEFAPCVNIRGAL